MNIEDMANKYLSLKDDVDMMEFDMFNDKKELEKKKKELNKLSNDLLFYDEFEDLYTSCDELDLPKEYLYPFKEEENEKGDLVCVCKNSEEYQEDVSKYLDELKQAYEDHKIDKKTYIKLEKDAKELGTKQMEKIKKEEKEKEKAIDLNDECKEIMSNVKNTRDRVVYDQIGDLSYGILKNKYINMTELERKSTLRKTNECICKELNIECDISFSKYDLDTVDTINKDGYCLLTKDVKGNEYPLEVMLFEQISKVYVKECMNRKEYTPLQKQRLNEMISKNIDVQKQMILDKYKKKELDIYNS